MAMSADRAETGHDDRIKSTVNNRVLSCRSEGYVLALKGNHPKLCEAVNQFFLDRHEHKGFSEYGCRQHQTVEKARGTTKTRHDMTAPVPDSMSH